MCHYLQGVLPYAVYIYEPYFCACIFVASFMILKMRLLHGIKAKLSLGLTNEAPHHEGVRGSACIDPRFLDLVIRPN
jgi:hypothetical protein